MEEIKLRKLENGITLITENISALNTFSMGFFIKTGAINEDKNLNETGISHFIEHLMFKGTKKRTAKEISEYVDFEGGAINAYTARDKTCYYIKMMSSKIDIAIDVLTDMLLNSTFEEENIEKERNVIIEEIKMYDDIPEEVVHDKAMEFAIKGIFSNSISGTAEDLKKITRKDIIRYLEKNYVAEKMVIVVSGNINEEYLYNELNEKLKDFRKMKEDSELDLSYEIISGENIVKNPSNQIHLCLTTRGVSVDSEMRYPAAIISNILGQGMSSRLFQNIREERGLAYSVYTYLSRFINCGLMTVYVGTTKEDYKEVIELIKKEFSEIKEHGISERELEKAKNKYESAFTFSLESTTSRMNSIASSYLTYGKIITIDEVKEEIKAVTLEDVKKAAQFLFDENYYSTTIVGNL